MFTLKSPLAYSVTDKLTDTCW